MSIRRSQLLVVASVAVIALMALSGAQAYDRTTWVLEVFPVAIALAILWVSYPSFPLTNLLYFLIFLHTLVLMTGGLYTYARVPVGFQIEDLLGLSRNPYDKLGHFFQGLVPALVAREILIRGRYVQGRKMLAFIVICIVLAISASYELFEWATAVALGQGADEFLGTQGIPGILNPICFSRSSVRSPPCSCFPASTIARFDELSNLTLPSSGQRPTSR